MSPNAGVGGVGCGVSANENICAHHVTWSPNKLWRSNSIFNLFNLSSTFEKKSVFYQRSFVVQFSIVSTPCTLRTYENGALSFIHLEDRAV
jgi:hypothetical protein